MKVRDIEIGNKIGESSHFRIYLGIAKEKSRQVILKVAKTFEDGDLLARDASEFYHLHVFEHELRLIMLKAGQNNPHYELLFANLVNSFLESTQGDRRINVFEIPGVSLDELTPLKKLYAETEIDVRTSAWILGRFFKFYGLFELIAIEEGSKANKYPVFLPDDFLIGVERHRLIYYNFSGDVPDVVAFDFVKAIAQFMISWTAEQNDYGEQNYLDLLKDFAENGRASFEEAHTELYKLVHELWGAHYYPYTYRDRNDPISWKTI